MVWFDVQKMYGASLLDVPFEPTSFSGSDCRGNFLPSAYPSFSSHERKREPLSLLVNIP